MWSGEIPKNLKQCIQFKESYQYNLNFEFNINIPEAVETLKNIWNLLYLSFYNFNKFWFSFIDSFISISLPAALFKHLNLGHANVPVRKYPS